MSNRNGAGRRLLWLSTVIALVALAFTASLFAQEVASITGVVTDSTGAVVSGVNVTLVNTNTNTTYQGSTNALGVYTIAKVLPGPGYKVTFKKDGFESVAISGVYLTVGTTRTQNAQMNVGKVTETVEVSAQGQGVTLNTVDATVGNSFSMAAVSQLPVQVRDNPAALLQVQPGVMTVGSSSDGLGSRAGSVTGARGDQNNITLDGLDVNDFATGQAYSVVGNAPVDTIQEFKGETAGSLAASGRGSGAQIQMVTKSGTNQFHGGVWEYHRNTATTANSWFNDLNGINKPVLLRNQFGAQIGGPVVKDKLFFFFDYNGRRDSQTSTASMTVPLDSLRAGNISYIKNAAGCTEKATQATAPQCIGTISMTDSKNYDPKAIGVNSALLQFMTGRYPKSNSAGGDGINTGGFRFNAPVNRIENDYVSRIDYNMNSSMKLFGRFSIKSDKYGDTVNTGNGAPMWFPGDPITHSIEDTSYAYVIGHTWTVSPTKVNQFTYGETVSRLAFPTNWNPAGTTTWSFGPLSRPYDDQSSQARRVPIPIFRDDFTWQKGNHNIQMGGTFKPIRTTSTLVGDFNSVTVGMGGNLSELDAAQRPADLLMDANSYAATQYDSAFAYMLGHIARIGSNYNYNSSLNPIPQGSGATRNYRYYELESYIQDTFKVNNALTLTFGLRYQYYSVPYEANGTQAAQNLGFNQYLFGRAANGMNSVSGYDATPIVYYDLAGKANGARGIYEPEMTDFAPRFSFAYSPSATNGFLGKLFGDRKTVIRGGSGLIYDHPVTNALNFIQDQLSYMFQNSATKLYAGDGTTALTSDPRFTGIGSIPTPPTAPTVARPFAPYTPATSGYWGVEAGDYNYAISPNLKTPYSIVLNFGIQRELPGHFVLESNYVGRLGRRLIAQADAAQLMDFVDPTANSGGQTMSQAFAALTTELRAGKNYKTVTLQPFFEHLVGCYGILCGTQAIAGYQKTLATKGDASDIVQWMSAFGMIDPNVGLPAQFGTNAYITNLGSSTYHGWLTTLHKNMSHGLQFDINYTFSHSIDNTSMISNSIASGLGFVCDAMDPRKCRGNSDFDAKHLVNGTILYDLPFGKGKAFASNAPGWLNQIIGGWNISGIPIWRSGMAFSTVTGAYLMGFSNNDPAIFLGDRNAVGVSVHKTDSDKKVWLFADPTAAAKAFRGPVGFEIGNRNSLRGPSYFNLDMAIGKRFPVTERVGVTFRAEAYNSLNHPSFGLPQSGGSGSATDITNANFGRITGTASTARVMQWSLRVEF